MLFVVFAFEPRIAWDVFLSEDFGLHNMVTDSKRFDIQESGKESFLAMEWKVRSSRFYHRWQ